MLQRLTTLARRRHPLELLSFATVWLSFSLWIRAKTVDQASRENAERRAIFVGLWPAMFWLIADTLQD